jgi:hypothetical protein
MGERGVQISRHVAALSVSVNLTDEEHEFLGHDFTVYMGYYSLTLLK